MAAAIELRVTCADMAEAKRIAAAALEAGLIACANAWPCESMFSWQGKMESEDEILLAIKTTDAAINALTKLIVTHHSYDTPAILWWPAEADDATKAWLASTVSAQ